MKNLFLIFLILFPWAIFSQEENKILQPPKEIWGVELLVPENKNMIEILVPENSEDLFSAKYCVFVEINFILLQQYPLENLLTENFEIKLSDSLNKFSELIQDYVESKMFLSYLKKQNHEYSDAEIYTILLSTKISKLIGDYYSYRPITVWKKIPNGQFQRTLTRGRKFPKEILFPDNYYVRTYSRKHK